MMTKTTMIMQAGILSLSWVLVATSGEVPRGIQRHKRSPVVVLQTVGLLHLVRHAANQRTQPISFPSLCHACDIHIPCHLRRSGADEEVAQGEVIHVGEKILRMQDTCALSLSGR